MRVLASHPIQLAFVFGSVASRNETSGSDIDLMVAGSVSLRTLVASLAGIFEKVGRELNPSVMTESKFSKRRRTGNYFVSTVMAARKLFVLEAVKDIEASIQKRRPKASGGS